MNPLRISFIAGIAAFATGVAIHFWPTPKVAELAPQAKPEKQQVAPPVKMAAATSLAPGILQPGYQWNVGDHIAYDLDMQWGWKPSASDAAPSIFPELALRCGGQLYFEVLEVSTRQVKAAVALLSPKVLGGNGLENRDVTQLFARTPCVVEMRPDGSVTRVLWPRVLAEQDRLYLQRALVWGFVAQKSATQWQTKEFGAEGEFTCTYQAMSDGRSIEKSRVLSKALPGSMPPRVLNSRFVGVPGKIWLDSLDGEETANIIIPASRDNKGKVIPEVVAGTSHLSIHLHPLGTQPQRPATIEALAIALTKANGLVEKGRKGAGILGHADGPQEPESLKGKPLQPLLTRLDSLLAQTPVDEGLLSQMKLEMTDWLRANPEQTAQMGALFADTSRYPDPKIGNLFANVLAQALADAHTPAADTLLAQFVQPSSTLSPGRIYQAIVASGQTSGFADPSLMNALTQRSSAPAPESTGQSISPLFLAVCSDYALSIRAVSDPDAKAYIINSFSPVANDWNNPDYSEAEVKHSLRVLGNAVPDVATPISIDIVDHSPSQALRQTAIETLGEIQGRVTTDAGAAANQAGNTALLQSLHDASEQVSSAAINALPIAPQRPNIIPSDNPELFQQYLQNRTELERLTQDPNISNTLRQQAANRLAPSAARES